MRYKRVKFWLVWDANRARGGLIQSIENGRVSY